MITLPATPVIVRSSECRRASVTISVLPISAGPRARSAPTVTVLPAAATTLPPIWPMTRLCSGIATCSPSEERSSIARTWIVRSWFQLPGVKTSVTDGAQVTPSSDSSTVSERIDSVYGDGAGREMVTTTSVVGANVMTIVNASLVWPLSLTWSRRRRRA